MSTCSTEFCKIICTKRKLALAEKSPNSLVLRYACKAFSKPSAYNQVLLFKTCRLFFCLRVFFCTDCAFCELFSFREKGAKLLMPVFSALVVVLQSSCVVGEGVCVCGSFVVKFKSVENFIL